MWDFISLAPCVAIPLLVITGYWNIAIGALVVSAIVKLIKQATLPYLTQHPWLMRPPGARNCDCINFAGSAEGRPGFPSGHAATITYIVIMLLLREHVATLQIFVGVSLIFLVGLSRTRKKCHTIPQVAAGTALGAIAGIIHSQLVQNKR